jgi:acetoacetyl-CoA synthetase
MMWNYLVSGLLVGASIVLFDGDPGFPDLGALWQLAAGTGVDVFGVSAPFLMSCRKAGVVPPPHRLRSIGSTGAPLPPDGFRWVRDVVGADVQTASVSGGTDVCAAFVGAVPLLPVRAGEISCRNLAVAVEAFAPDGSVCPPGVQGELVVTEPMPSMPVAFWGDPTGEKLRHAYFDDYPGVWRHGDWITFTDDGACVISGRSDATLNRGGVRLGTSDFYAVVEGLPEVADSLVVHLEGADPENEPMGELLLFVALAPGATLDDDLRAAILRSLRTELSPRHVPDAILAVPAVPRTLSGKKLEVPVKRILGGAAADAVASRSSLADPTALDWFEEYATTR